LVPKSLHAKFLAADVAGQADIAFAAVGPSERWEKILSRMGPAERLVALVELAEPSAPVKRPVTHKVVVAERRSELIAKLTAERDELRKEVPLRDVVYLNDEEKEKYPSETWEEMTLRKEIKRMQQVRMRLAEQLKAIKAKEAAAERAQREIAELHAKVAAMTAKLTQTPGPEGFGPGQ
jgi:hypothetical protein